MAKNKPAIKGKGKKFKGKNVKGKNFKGKKSLKNKAKLPYDANARIVVRNLSFKTTDKSLRQHFDTYGRIVNIELPKRPNGDLVGCGFIQYENIDSAKQGLESRNGQPFLGRSLQIDWAVPKDDFLKHGKKPDIANTPDNNMDVDLTNATDKDNESMTIDPKIKTKKFPKKRTNEEEKESEKKPRVVRKARLIVRNISFKATEETLKKHFEPYGEVIETTLLKKPNGDLVGCGFVQFKAVNMATNAIAETNSKPFLGRPIHVDWAVAKNKYMAHVTEKEDEIEYLKNDVKSEPESDEEMDTKIDTSNVDVKEESDSDDNSDKSENSEDDLDSDDEKDDDEDEEDDDDDDDDNDDDDNVKIKREPTGENLRKSANDAEDGNTVFIKNVAFSVTNDDLQEFAKKFGETVYALVCVDKLTEHSKGSAFVRFKSKEDADIFLSSGPDKLVLHEQTLQPFPAMLRDHAKKDRIKQPKDSRNLYLIKEGLILANTKAASGVSLSDMSKRLSLEQKKSQLLRNLNRFISRYRLTIHNIPPHFNDEDLKKVCLEMANAKPFCLKECRVMKHLKGPLDTNGKHMSKGFGFVTFTKHEDALACLRRMNNNPSIFDKNNRPIVSFSIEDKAVINARNKRLEKSKIRNPLHANYKPEPKEESDPVDSKNPDNRKNFKGRNKNFKVFNKNQKTDGRKQIQSGSEYMGEVGMPGKQLKMRNRYKLQMQVSMHKENVKQEKRNMKFTKQKKKIGVKERIKQPKQKQNTRRKNKMV